MPFWIRRGFVLCVVWGVMWASLEEEMKRFGLVDGGEQSGGKIIVFLIYSTTNNFLDKDVYGELEKAYLVPEAAERLIRAQHLLGEKKPGYRLVVYDATRPVSLQKKMWDMAKDTPKARYVANPQKGSLHSYGVAVDGTVVDEKGYELDMGTPVDYFGELAEPRYESRFLTEGKLTPHQVSNRLLLREVMRQAGFQDIVVEWWHFQLCGREEAKKRFLLIP
ncbi:MAG: hypothetical protein N2314_03115 [Brevinematales bacterium]|nr:hypothetical protein [Brevinematales bacterium]